MHVVAFSPTLALPLRVASKMKNMYTYQYNSPHYPRTSQTAVWRWTLDGSCSVKSAYRALHIGVVPLPRSKAYLEYLVASPGPYVAVASNRASVVGTGHPTEGCDTGWPLQ
jgi:hypothetical protein